MLPHLRARGLLRGRRFLYLVVILVSLCHPSRHARASTPFQHTALNIGSTPSQSNVEARAANNAVPASNADSARVIGMIENMVGRLLARRSVPIPTPTPDPTLPPTSPSPRITPTDMLPEGDWVMPGVSLTPSPPRNQSAVTANAPSNIQTDALDVNDDSGSSTSTFANLVSLTGLDELEQAWGRIRLVSDDVGEAGELDVLCRRCLMGCVTCASMDASECAIRCHATAGCLPERRETSCDMCLQVACDDQHFVPTCGNVCVLMGSECARPEIEIPMGECAKCLMGCQTPFCRDMCYLTELCRE